MRTYALIGFIAAIIGLGAGLGYAWYIDPVQYTTSTPAQLMPQYRPTLITLIAASYAVENDWGRANFRLNSLGDPNIGKSVAKVTRRAIAELQPAPILRALVRLADRLGERTPEMMVYLATPLPISTPVTIPPTPLPPTPTPTKTPSPSPTFALPATPTPLPTLTPTPTPLPGYLLVSQDRLCQTGLSASLLQAVVENEKGEGVPGMEIWVSWEGGADRFVTGLKPELGPGYGDLQMRPNIAYNVSVGTSTLPLASGLRAEVCPSDVPTQTAFAVWRLVFRPVPPTPTPTPTSTPTETPTFPTAQIDATSIITP
jgi:hypothetical protein